MNKEFLEFMTGKESVPEHLKSLAKKDILLSFHAKSIIAKFLGFQLLGALFSMSVCPQFGLGLVDGHGITHMVRMIGDWACAAFCGSLFLSAGLMVAFIGMKGEELWWVWNRYKFSLIFLPAILWSGLMLTNISLDLTGESISYHVMWIVSAVVAQWALLKMRSTMFLKHATLRY
ncbi:hypothetical protein [Peredibacter starrii]|uniref:Uncharacterized protein n=1 Tax=Peredibacter starrii TaxID=28202 RepID=A0AAX4HJU1_9BACT|nr:hypothetical protein [Peredibacter starrii]WPU63454.1 hypothetical protein SOO65_12220 [Peredibacter starrii]